MCWNKQTADWVITVLSALTAAMITLCVVTLRFVVETDKQQAINLAHAMYTFSSPRELVEKQQIVKNLLSEELWEQLQLDNEDRAINAYYKFKYSASQVKVMRSYQHGILYQAVCENLSEGDRYLLFVDASTGIITSVTEYHLLGGRGSVSVDDFG